MNQAAEHWETFKAELYEPSKLDAVFEFMSGLACALDKEVFLTPESMHDIRIFRIRPQADLVEHTPFGGFA